MTDEQTSQNPSDPQKNSHTSKSTHGSAKTDDKTASGSSTNSTTSAGSTQTTPVDNSTNTPISNGDEDLQTEFEMLRQELEDTQTKLSEMTNITQHALADLQNSRRRAEEERTAYVTYANADLLTQLLPVLESMNKALAHEPKDADWIKGAEATIKQFQQTLEKRGLIAIEALNKPFDPKIHEALMAGPGEKDQVLEEYEKGYMLGDKVLKRSRVRVGNGESIS